MEQQQIIDGLQRQNNIFIGIIFVVFVVVAVIIKIFLDVKSELETELEKTKTELEKTKTELKETRKSGENLNINFEKTKSELEKTTSFLYVIYLSFARLSAAIRSEFLIRNQTKTSALPIVDEIGKFLDKYTPEKIGGRSEFVKIESEFKTKLDQLTSLDIKSIDLAYK
jgi:hypothetical protein